MSFRAFLRDDGGAVTLDWVAMTAGVLVLGIMVVFSVFNNGVSSLAGRISTTLSSASTDVDLGFTPALYELPTSDGRLLPHGSVVVDNGDGRYKPVTVDEPLKDSNGAPALDTEGNPLTTPVDYQDWQPGTGVATLKTPDGATITTRDFVGTEVGTTVSSGNTLTTPDGTTVSSGSCASAFSCGSSSYKGDRIPG